MEPLILAVNPGSTSTKAALFRGKEMILSREIKHSLEELEHCDTIWQQAPLRKRHLLELLAEAEVPVSQLAAVVGIGGVLPPVEGGIYRVDEKMVDYLKHRAHVDHASNLGGILGYELAHPLGIPAYICDPVTTDELEEVARLSGLPELPRVSTFHALNIKAMARKTAEQLGKPLENCNLIVGHLGGGVSYAALRGGRAVDLVLDDEGSFSPVRSGGLPASDLVSYCYSGKWPDGKSAYARVRGNGGFKAYLGTTDLMEILNRIEEGDRQAALVFEAYGYQISKSIAQLSAVFSGQVDAIVLTGGAARCQPLTDAVTARIGFLGLVYIQPGEMELEALGLAALRALNGEEAVKTFREGCASS